MPRTPKPYLALPSPWLVAHRGGSRLAPQTTLAAFDRAAALGADAIETDVRLSRDGVVPGRSSRRTASPLTCLRTPGL